MVPLNNELKIIESIPNSLKRGMLEGSLGNIQKIEFSNSLIDKAIKVAAAACNCFDRLITTSASSRIGEIKLINDKVGCPKFILNKNLGERIVFCVMAVFNLIIYAKHVLTNVKNFTFIGSCKHAKFKVKEISSNTKNSVEIAALRAFEKIITTDDEEQFNLILRKELDSVDESIKQEYINKHHKTRTVNFTGIDILEKMFVFLKIGTERKLFVRLDS